MNSSFPASLFVLQQSKETKIVVCYQRRYTDSSLRLYLRLEDVCWNIFKECHLHLTPLQLSCDLDGWEICTDITCRSVETTRVSSRWIGNARGSIRSPQKENCMQMTSFSTNYKLNRALEFEHRSTKALSLESWSVFYYSSIAHKYFEEVDGLKPPELLRHHCVQMCRASNKVMLTLVMEEPLLKPIT